MLTDYTSAMFNRPFKAYGARSAGLPARFGGSMNSSGTIIHIPDCPPNPAELTPDRRPCWRLQAYKFAMFNSPL